MSDPGYDGQTGEVMPRGGLPVHAEPREARNLIFASADCAEVFGALCDFQGVCEAPKKTKTATVKGTTRQGDTYDYKYQYAPLDEIHNVIRAPMKEAGLAYRQFLASRDGNWMMRTIVAHRSGQWIGCDYPIFGGRQEGAQGFASGVTYARRYGLMLALGIVAEDDDDANVADAQPATVQGRDTAQRALRPNGAAQPQMTELQAEAKKRHAELVAEIDRSQTIPEIDELIESPAWAAFQRIGGEAFPELHDGVSAKLVARAQARKKLLLGDDGPMTVGEAG